MLLSIIINDGNAYAAFQ